MANLDELMRRMDDAQGRQDAAAYSALFAEDAVLEFPGREPIKGREAIKSFVQTDASAASDIKMTLLSRAVSGNTIMSEWRSTRTMAGDPNLGVAATSGPATAKRLNHKMVTVVEAEGGLVKSVRAYFDTMEVLKQLGISPAQMASSAGASGKGNPG